MKALTNFFDRIVRRFLPDAFLFAVILTLIVLVMGIAFTDHSIVDMIGYWGGGFWDLLEFAMQMSLIVVTGYILANTPVVKSALIKISQLANTPVQAVVLVTFVASIACLIVYGFGFVFGALVAVCVGVRGALVNFGLFVAASYMWFFRWHGG